MEEVRNPTLVQLQFPDPAYLRTVHLVFVTHLRYQAFEDELSALRMLHILLLVAMRHDIIIHEAAVMPDHVHVVLSFGKNRHLERDVVKKLKGSCSRLFFELIGAEDLVAYSRHLWGVGRHFDEIRNAKHFFSVLCYVRMNPENAGISATGRVLSLLSTVNPAINCRVNHSATICPVTSSALPM